MTAASSRARNGLWLMASSSSMRNLMTHDPDSSQAAVEECDAGKALERADAVAAQALGVGQRPLGGRDQVFRGRRVGREPGHAETGGDRSVREGLSRDDAADPLRVRSGA